MLNPTNLRDRANEWEERIISDFREGRADLKMFKETPVDAAMAMAEAVRARIAGVPFDSVGHVSASFGVATWDHKEDSHALIKRADTALYKAKSSGRNCVVQAEDAA